MSEKSAKLLLAAVILARSTSYVMIKIGLDALGPFNLMAIRFLLAFFIMLALFWKRIRRADRASLLAGILIGAVFFLVMTLEVFSLKTCESSVTAFLEGTAIVIVPLIEAPLLRRLPQPKAALGLLLALGGVALMTLRGASLALTAGHLLALGAAASYAGALLVTDRLAKQRDALVIGIVQLGTMGALSLLASFLFEAPHFPHEPMAWLAIVLLACVCSCFGFTLQPVAQRYTSAQTAGLYTALAPLGAGIFGWIFLGEALDLAALLGAALILGSILLVQTQSKHTA